MRLLHAGPDLLCYWNAGGGESRLVEPRQRPARRSCGAERSRNLRANERQPLPLLGLSEHRRCNTRRCGGRPMKSFDYERAESPEAAVLHAAQSGARFIAGGTNLLDLMKLEIETPERLVDISRLDLSAIE